jgi:hypothetical protein
MSVEGTVILLANVEGIRGYAAGSFDWLAFFMEDRIESRANLVKSAHIHFARVFCLTLAPI